MIAFSIVSILVFSIAAALNALMDKLQFHFSTSIFFTKDSRYWDPAISWRNKYVDRDPAKRRRKIFGVINMPVAFTDAWHLAKTLMIGVLIISAILFQLGPRLSIFEHWFYNGLIWFGAYSLVWNLTFNLFFNKLFATKNKSIV